MIPSIDNGASSQITTGAGQKVLKNKTTITPFEEVLKKTQKSEEEQMDKGTIVNKSTQTEDSSNSTIKVPAKLKSIFEKASKKYNVSYQFLVSIAKAESNFNANSTSGSGAMGIMQLMPATAKELGCKDPYDSEQNIMAGAKYLSAHLKAFDGDMEKAAAAYNAGGAAVRKYDGIPPYKETQNYVKIVMKYYNQGVTVPNKTVQVASTDSSSTTTGTSESTTNSVISTAVAATTTELNKSTVVVGSGDGAETLSYEAYLQYLKLGTTGKG